MKLIGICGYAQSGKDTLCNGMIRVLDKNKIKAIRVSIADIIRDRISDFIKKEFDIDVCNTTPFQKNKIRPLLVEYGLIRRKESEGKFFTEILDKKIKKFKGKYDVVIITDIRYAEYEEDELFWLKSKHNGKLVHIDRIVDHDQNNSPMFLTPPNEQEEKNIPLLKEKADYKLVWNTMGDMTNSNLDYYYNKSEIALKMLECI